MSGLISADSPMQTAYLPNTPFDAPHNPLISVTRFRADFTAFADETVYPAHSVQFFLDIAGLMVIPRYWCNFTVFGQELVCAHFLALQQFSIARAQAAAAGGAVGAVPGINAGLMTSKSVSKVSVGYDPGHTSLEDAGPWNYTVWGTQYWQLVQMVGTGGIEMLSVGFHSSQAGLVQSWAHGVMSGWYGSA